MYYRNSPMMHVMKFKGISLEQLPSLQHPGTMEFKSRLLPSPSHCEKFHGLAGRLGHPKVSHEPPEKKKNIS